MTPLIETSNTHAACTFGLVSDKHVNL